MIPIGRTVSAMLLALILVSHLALSVAYNILQPIGEAPDEPAHVEYIRYVQEHRALPVGQANAPAHLNPLARGIEFDQAPLYYLILAGVLSPIWLPPHAAIHRNPFVGWPDRPDSLANAYHRLDESWPYGQLALFVHLGRLFSGLCALVTLVATFGLVLAITGRRVDALFATTWLAWTPGFVLASSRLNNDASAMAFSALTFWLCARLLVRPSPPSTAGLAALSLVLTGALLSKLHTLVLVPLVFVAVLAAADGHRLWRRGVAATLTLAIPITCLAAWYLAYGRTFGRRLAVTVGFGVAQLASDLSRALWTRLPAALWFLNATWWGRVREPLALPWLQVVYAVLALLLILLIGAGLGATWKDPSRSRRGVALCCLAALPLLYATVARQVFPWVDLDSNARFLLPVAPVVALVVTIGGRALPFGRLRRPLACAYLAGILSLAVATAVFVLPRISAPGIPARLERDRWEASAPAAASLANGVDLLLVKGVPAALQPGATLPVVLRWRVEHPPKQDFTVFTQLIRNGTERIAASHDEIPYQTTFPPTLWQTDEIIDESQPIRLPLELPAGVYSLRVGAYHLVNGEITPIPIVSSEPPRESVVAATWVVLPDPAGFRDAHPTTAWFGQALRLRAFSLQRDGDTLRASLYWEAARPIATSDAVSLQVLDLQGRLIAQHDGQPVAGHLPMPTWPPGRLVRDDHVVRLAGAASPVRVFVVVYDPTTGQRLPVVAPGRPVADRFELRD